MPTIDTITGKDAADATVTIASIQAESGVEIGAVAAGRIRALVKVSNAFGVTGSVYASGDVVDTKATVSSVLIRNGSTGSVVRARLILAQSIPAVVPSFVLHLFNEDPTGSTFTDNAALAVTEADAQLYAGPIGFGAYTTLATGVHVYDSGTVEINLNPASGSSSIYAVLEIKTATTFTADELHLQLEIEQDR